MSLPDFKMIYIRTTHNCNYKCPYCHPWNDMQTIKDKEEQFQGVIEGVFDKYFEKITFIGITGGEPFTYPDRLFSTLDKIEKFNEKRIKGGLRPVFSVIATNGTYLTKEIVKELNKYSTVRTQISLDCILKGECYKSLERLLSHNPNIIDNFNNLAWGRIRSVREKVEDFDLDFFFKLEYLGFKRTIYEISGDLTKMQYYPINLEKLEKLLKQIAEVKLPIRFTYFSEGTCQCARNAILIYPEGTLNKGAYCDAEKWTDDKSISGCSYVRTKYGTENYLKALQLMKKYPNIDAFKLADIHRYLINL
jgi:uncharacterized Fe-S cluster-containing radical SAM superfamily protein